MAQLVVAGALIKCSFGDAPAPLIVEPEGGLVTAGVPPLPVATIMNFLPLINIPPFVLCNSPANPEVEAATAAALGVFMPMPCIPVTVEPWAPGAPTVLINDVPALTQESTCMCIWGGEISILEPGQEQVSTPE